SGQNKRRTEITGNKFTNCQNMQSTSGVLSLFDYNNISYHHEMIISNNSFIDNRGKWTGCIYLDCNNSETVFQFYDNQFINSENYHEQFDGKGTDATMYLYVYPFYSIDSDIRNAESVVRSIFRGSSSNAAKDSVFYQTYLYGEFYDNGYIKLPEISNVRTTYLIISIVIGVMILAVLAIILIGVGIYLKGIKPDKTVLWSLGE
ncbi:MAG: hypothetical protein EZS28_049060, partial [Streblomastix strix]